MGVVAKEVTHGSANGREPIPMLPRVTPHGPQGRGYIIGKIRMRPVSRHQSDIFGLFLRLPICLFPNICFPVCPYGSPKTKDFEDAPANPQGISPLVGASDEQMWAVRKHNRLSHGVFLLRLLQRPPGLDG
jgi:hypothetical protein